MTGQELATAVQYGANIIVLVVDNSMYGTIRMHQERHFPGRADRDRPAEPRLRRTGARLRRVRRARRDRRRISCRLRARRQGAARPRLLHLPLDPEAITPRETLSGIRKKASRAELTARRADVASPSSIV